MRQGLLIWNLVLTLATGFLLVMQFTGGRKGSAGSGKAGDTTRLENKPVRIAYFEMDSLANRLEIVKNFKTELTRKEDAMTAEMDRMSRQFQEKYNYYLGQGQAGNLSQTQSEAASMELKRLDDDMKARKQQLDQEYSDYMVRRQNEIKSKIETFLKEYNKGKDYTYIVSYEQGLFYYRDTAYNITADVISGMNSLYKPEKKN